MRLIEAAETLFIRQGFDDTSVDEISEMAGYSRGAFYSNFEDKDQLFLAVIDRRWPSVSNAIEAIFQNISGPAERAAAVREWYSNQWRHKEFIALQMDFARKAEKDCSARRHLAELRRRELETVTASVVRYFNATGRVPVDRPELLALAFLAVSRGLATLAIEAGPEMEQLYTEASTLAFDRMSAPPISTIG
ncbi:MAG TPA: TetR/AcrR family transcriptional regulator [Bryobacteraceae bacterium]|nr:TetR/AcrR family transcriptional regulator [Bryobacteraceae bacterium]